MALPERVYHLAEAVNLPSIGKLGLWPAADLVRAAYPSAREQEAAVRRHRPTHTVLPSGVHVRDQSPMPKAALEKCLVGLTATQWYALLNSHVFFWLDAERMNRQRRACSNRPQAVLVIRTASLLEQLMPQTYVTPINVGYALRRPARRGVETLVPYSDWLSSGWLGEAAVTGAKVRSRSHPPAELLVRGRIPPLRTIVESVVELQGDQPFVPSAAS